MKDPAGRLASSGASLTAFPLSLLDCPTTCSELSENGGKRNRLVSDQGKSRNVRDRKQKTGQSHKMPCCVTGSSIKIDVASQCPCWKTTKPAFKRLSPSCAQRPQVQGWNKDTPAGFMGTVEQENYCSGLSLDVKWW